MLDLSKFTKAEKVRILDEAFDLISEPENWIQGTWKCPIRDPKTGTTKLDKKGNPKYAYCVEGAVNQAVVNLFGQERANAVGVNQDMSGNYMADTLFLDKLASDLYHGSAQSFNDRSYYASDPSYEGNFGPTEEKHKRGVHQRVLDLLRLARKEIKTA